MGKPTEAELTQALETAAHMRETGQDPHHMAKALLNLHYRMRYLDRVLHCAELYLRGMGVHEHSELQRAIREAKEADRRTTTEDPQHFGLD